MTLATSMRDPMKPFLLLAILIFGTTSIANAEIITKELTYSAGVTTLKGFLAYDDAIKGKRPGILVVHEWWGQNEYIHERARMLAGLGYTALALDMYGEGKQAEHPDDAGAFSKAVMSDLPVAQARFEAALDLLKKQETVDPKNIAAIGYCFGGGVVLTMARLGVDLKGVVSFHGSLGSDAKTKSGAVKAKILVCNGAADPFVTADQIDALKKEMAAANADMTFKSYADAKHAFTNPGATALGKKFNLPLAYNKAADKASWADMQKFFHQIFAK